MLKVSDQSDPLKETLTYAVLDDQSTNVFITDALQSKLNLSGVEVNLQVNTIVGTNTVRMRRVHGQVSGSDGSAKAGPIQAAPPVPNMLDLNSVRRQGRSESGSSEILPGEGRSLR